MAKSSSLLILLLICQQALCQIRKEELYREKGFVVEKLEIKQGISTTIIVAIIDPSILKAKVEGYTKEYSGGLSPLRVINNQGIKVVLGSGFVKSYFPLEPNGFLKIRSNVISPVNSGRDSYTEIVGVVNGSLKFLSNTNKQGLLTLNEGFQTGPPLILKDVDEYARRGYRGSKEPYNRSFVGINYDGKVIAAITEGPVHLRDLAKFLAEQKEIKELKCKTIINMSGGSAEALVFKKADGSIHSFGGGAFTKGASLLAFN